VKVIISATPILVTTPDMTAPFIEPPRGTLRSLGADDQLTATLSEAVRAQSIWRSGKVR